MTAERYTAVFTGLLDPREPREYPYLTMSEKASGSDSYILHRGRPPYGKLGGEIGFTDLPEECRRLVLETYRELWGLKADISGRLWQH